MIWDTIANSFDKTRRKPWNICLEFIESLPSDATIVDLGCGNGRHLIPCSGHCREVIGLDISRNLLRIIRERTKGKSNIHLIHGDLRSLPFEDNVFDAALYIASLHNIKGRGDRIKTLKEMYRILRENGVGLISVWSRWQDRYRRIFLKKIFIRRRGEEFGDTIIYWKQSGLNIPRFYHLYSKREFLSDVEEAGFKVDKVVSVKIVSKKYPDNYFAYVRKT
ncbi:MAG TPA: class I SAM-dependent methyltransferase [Thermoplasmatales archaeon]|nr:class I SAM-dependent methyltransferase [Thermoplasmatales archaeon]